jgi:hypothetical protein
MSWSWFSQLSDAFKKRVGKYLINRYLGPFLDEGILLNQLSVDGPIRLRDVALNTSYINAFLEDADIPLEFIDGYIRELSVTVPMANLLKDNCLFEINGLTLTLQVSKFKVKQFAFDHFQIVMNRKQDELNKCKFSLFYIVHAPTS